MRWDYREDGKNKQREKGDGDKGEKPEERKDGLVFSAVGAEMDMRLAAEVLAVVNAADEDVVIAFDIDMTDDFAGQVRHC